MTTRFYIVTVSEEDQRGTHYIGTTTHMTLSQLQDFVKQLTDIDPIYEKFPHLPLKVKSA